MFGTIKKILGIGPSVNFSELVAAGAQIIDVRSESEFKSGHIKGSINIPLNVLNSKVSKLKKERVVITCCASGMRSASAKSILKSRGYEVYNGGGWMSLRNKLN